MDDKTVAEVAFANLPSNKCALTNRPTSDPVVMHKDLSDWFPPSLHDMRDDRVRNLLIVDKYQRKHYYEKLKNIGIVVAFSGGLDSTTVLHWCLKVFGKVHCLIFDYGQRHSVEIDSATSYISQLLESEENQGRLKYTLVDMHPINKLATSALTRDIELPSDRNADDMSKDIPITFVPGRNVYFVTALAQVAYREGWRHIALGVNILDYSVGGSSLVFLRDKSGNIESCKIEDCGGKWEGKQTASVNLNTNKVEWRDITGWFKHDVSKNKKYRITTERGQIIEVTDGHSLFTIDEESTYLTEVTGDDIRVGMPLAIPMTCAPDVMDKELESLNLSGLIDQFDQSTARKMVRVEGDQLCFRDKKHPINYPVTDEFLRIVGLWLAEGGKEHTSKHHTLSFSIGGIDKNARMFEKYFISRGYRVHRYENGFDLSITSKLYDGMFRYLGLLGTAKRGEKEFPPFYWKLSQRQKRIVVAALYDGDGCKSNRHSIDISQKSHAIINGLYQTFLIDGIFPVIKDGQHDQKILKITCSQDAGKFIMHYPMWHYEKLVSYSIMALSKGKDKSRGFWKCKGIWDKVKASASTVGLKTDIYCAGGKYDQSFRAKRTAISDVPELSHLVDTHISMQRVTHIEEIECQFMYDFSVDGNQNFIANGILAHNSGYPDCRPEFLEAMRVALRVGIFNGTDLGMHAPLMYYNKKQIIRLGHELGVDYARTHSCYDGVPGGCGKCDSCVIRRTAFEDLGSVDPAIAAYQ